MNRVKKKITLDDSRHQGVLFEDSKGQSPLDEPGAGTVCAAGNCFSPDFSSTLECFVSATGPQPAFSFPPMSECPWVEVKHFADKCTKEKKIEIHSCSYGNIFDFSP